MESERDIKRDLDRLEEQGDEMDEQTDKLEKEIEDTREDVESKERRHDIPSTRPPNE